MDSQNVAIVNHSEFISVGTQVDALDLPVYLDQWHWEHAVQRDFSDLKKGEGVQCWLKFRQTTM